MNVSIQRYVSEPPLLFSKVRAGDFVWIAMDDKCWPLQGDIASQTHGAPIQIGVQACVGDGTTAGAPARER